MKNRTKLVSLLLALALLLAMLPATVLAESPQENPPPVAGEYEVVITDCALPDYDDYTEAELLEGYLYSISGLYDGAAAFHAPRKPLPEETQTIYDALKTLVREVAAGKRDSTTFTLSDLSWTKTKDDWGIAGNVIVDGALTEPASTAIKATLNIDALLQRMLSEMPFEMYWFDKTKGIRMSYSVSLSGDNVTVSNLTIFMHVSQAYAKINESEGTYNPLLADTKKTSAAKTTAESARTIVTDNSSLTDYNKLVAYRNTICELVSYNNEATAPGYPYGDPWQLIYVFDGDESTNVVCEGYSKAFKYLCDLSAFTNDITCSLVTGRMAGGTGEGNHMWNVVAISGSNYLVDVTNCDTRTVGAPDKLFLCGAAENVPGKKYTATAGSQSIVYEYDAKTLSDYASSDLKLEEMPYSPTGVSGLTVSGTIRSYGSASESITVTLVPIGGSPLVKSVTGSSVTYSFTGVSAGNYTLKVEKKGHAPWTESITVSNQNIYGKDVTVYLWGDVNRDGYVTAADAQEIQRKAAGLSSVFSTDPNTAYCISRADVNNDNRITAADAQEIQRKAAGLSSTIDSLP